MDWARGRHHTRMARKARRDCRVVHRKKNHINIRVEELQQSIRKAKKEGKGKAKAAPAPAPAITPAAADFLSQMRSEVTEHIVAERERILPRSAATATDNQKQSTADR